MSIKIKRKSVKCRVVSEVLRLCQKFWGLNESQVIELRRKEIICCGGKIIRNLLYVIYVYELSFSLYTKLHCDLYGNKWTEILRSKNGVKQNPSSSKPNQKIILNYFETKHISINNFDVFVLITSCIFWFN